VEDPKITWTTVDEIRFIERLGEWGALESKLRIKTTPERLRQKYKNSVKGRVVWNDIDKDEVIAYLEGKAQVVNGAGPKGRAYVKFNRDYIE
jgi:hypothetical protein